MCVTHGLTSVNPKKYLIGHHVDWARGFPFEAFGLPDQYARPLPSVELFGFGYDEELLKVMGEPVAGGRAGASRRSGGRRRGWAAPSTTCGWRGGPSTTAWMAEQARDEQARAELPAP